MEDVIHLRIKPEPGMPVDRVAFIADTGCNSQDLLVPQKDLNRVKRALATLEISFTEPSAQH